MTIEYLIKEFGEVCGTCKYWKTCPHTEGWRIQQCCSRIDNCHWTDPRIEKSIEEINVIHL